MLHTIKLVVPIPPSINESYATDWGTKRRFLSKKAIMFNSDASSRLFGVSKKPLTHNITLTLSFYFKDRRRRDISNYIKVSEDALVKNKIIIDDSKVDHLYVHRMSPDKENPRLEIEVSGEV